MWENQWIVETPTVQKHEDKYKRTQKNKLEDSHIRPKVFALQVGNLCVMEAWERDQNLHGQKHTRDGTVVLMEPFHIGCIGSITIQQDGAKTHIHDDDADFKQAATQG